MTQTWRLMILILIFFNLCRYERNGGLSKKRNTKTERGKKKRQRGRKYKEKERETDRQT